MIGYTLVGTNDLERAKGFYDALFGEIGVSRMMEMESMCAWGESMDKPAFGVTKPYDGNAATVGNGTMIALVVDTRDKVDRLHARRWRWAGRMKGQPVCAARKDRRRSTPDISGIWTGTSFARSGWGQPRYDNGPGVNPGPSVRLAGRPEFALSSARLCLALRAHS